MKKIAIALLASAIATPAFAAEGNIYDGYASFSGGIGWTSTENSNTYNDQEPVTNNSSTQGMVLEARASGAAPITDSLVFQVDAVNSRNIKFFNDNANGEYRKINESTFAAHLSNRNPEQGLYGIVLQRTMSNGTYEPIYLVGAEGQYFLNDKTTFYVQASYLFDDTIVYQSDGYNLGAQLRYFPKPNLALRVEGNYQKLNRDNSTESYTDRVDVKSWMLGVSGEYRLPNSRFSLISGFSFTRGERDAANSLYSFFQRTNDKKATIGIKINFGSQTLIERDRKGASLDPVRINTPEISHYHPS